MDLNLPEYEPIRLANPPLQVVTCQLRFPPIIELVHGTGFGRAQNHLVAEYPRTKRTQLHLQPAVTGSREEHLLSEVWAFEDMDGRWTLTLAPDFLAIETRAYTHFGEFIERFQQALKSIQDEFPINLRTRIGLRYQDIVTSSAEARLPAGWETFLNPQFNVWEKLFPGAKLFQTSSCVVRGEGMSMNVSAGLATDGFEEGQAPTFILDCDCYDESTATLEGLDHILEKFHNASYRMFRWSLAGVIDYYERTDTVDSPEVKQ